MIKIGLTGSIGMGKSTTAKIFEERGIPVWDADAAVHRLYGPDGAATKALKKHFPLAVGDQGVDRTLLKQLIADDPAVLKTLESIVHPLVAEDRHAFVAEATGEQQDAVLLDIPLLFETGSAADMDVVVVVSAPADLQRARVLERPGMTESHFSQILAKQMPDAEKRKRANFVIDTRTMASAAEGVDQVLKHVTEMRNA